MTDDMPSDLRDQMVVNESFFQDSPSQPIKPRRQRLRIRSEEDVTMRSLVLGTLIGGALLAVCTVLWFMMLILPIWGFRWLLF